MIEVYGASDDLIEVEGDIREEFYAIEEASGDGGLLSFSDGTVFGIRYSDAGVWRIAPVVKGTAFEGITQAPEDDDDNYSDRALLGEGVTWVVFGSKIAKATTTQEGA